MGAKCVYAEGQGLTWFGLDLSATSSLRLPLPRSPTTCMLDMPTAIHTLLTLLLLLHRPERRARPIAIRRAHPGHTRSLECRWHAE